MANIELDGVNKKIKVDSGDLTLDVPGDIILDADGADVVFADGGTNILKVTNSSSDVVFQPQVDAKDIIFKQYDGTTVATVEDNGTFNIPTDKLAINGTAVTATAAELNLIDGGTSRGTTAIADGDGVLINDAGTMRQTTVETLKTYIGGFDVSSITGATALGETPADTDEFILSDAGTLKRVDFSYIKANSTPAFCATMSADQTGGNNDMVKIAYNTEVFDTDSAYDHSSNYRFTVPSGKAGKYFFSAMTNIHSSGSNPARSQTNSIYVNNSSIVRSQLFSASGAGSIFEKDQDNICHCTLLHDLSVGDYVEVFAKRYSDHSENIKAKTSFSRFMGFKLA